MRSQPLDFKFVDFHVRGDWVQNEYTTLLKVMCCSIDCNNFQSHSTEWQYTEFDFIRSHWINNLFSKFAVALIAPQIFSRKTFDMSLNQLRYFYTFCDAQNICVETLGKSVKVSACAFRSMTISNIVG